MPRQTSALSPISAPKLRLTHIWNLLPTHKMGSSASKPARAAAGAAKRQYPKQATPPPRAPAAAPKETKAPEAPTPQPTPPPSQPPRPAPGGPTYHTKEQPSHVKSNGMHSFAPLRSAAIAATSFAANDLRFISTLHELVMNTLTYLSNSNRPRRPRPRLCRLPPLYRARQPQPNPLPLQHL